MWLAVGSSLLVVLPFCCVQFLPVTDLPQHLAQIPLFLDALYNPNSVYRIQWDTPYSLVYVVIGAAWAVLPPLEAGRVAMIVLALLWTAAAHGLAAARGRAPEAAVLASALVFNHALYWGFLSFLIGWPVFVLWLLQTFEGGPRRYTWRRVALLVGTGALLYLAHVLWLGMALGWVGLQALVDRAKARRLAVALAALAPAVVAAAWWYPRLAAAGFASPTVWFDRPTGRLSYSWLLNATFGGVSGATEYVFWAVLVIWVGLGFLQARARRRVAADRGILLASAMFIVLAIFLPTEHTNTIQFAERWLPPGIVLLVVGSPAPLYRSAFLRWVSLAVLGAFCAAVAVSWQTFERQELAGLVEALRRLPPGQRVLGLDVVKTSPTIKGRPFLETFAYAQVLKKGELNFSFAAFAPSPVVYRSPRPAPWTAGLEWFAEWARSGDFQHFDYVLVNAGARVHDAFRADAAFAAVTTEGRWRLYRVVDPAG